MKTILIDFHGVLTDGRRSISHDGSEMFEHVHCRDIRAIRELLARGYYVAIVTASASPIIKAFADRLHVNLIVAREKKSVAAMFEEFIAIGDDAWDLPLLTNASRAFCPADADPLIKQLLGVQILKTAGGHGVIAEMLPLIAQMPIDNQ